MWKRILHGLAVSCAIFSVGYFVVWGCATPSSGAGAVPLSSGTATAGGVTLEGGGVVGEPPVMGGAALWLRRRAGPHLEIGGALSAQALGGIALAPNDLGFPVPLNGAARFLIGGMSGRPGDPRRVGTQLTLDYVFNSSAGAGPGATLGFPVQWEVERGHTFYVVPALGGAIYGMPFGTGAYADLQLTVGGASPLGGGVSWHYFGTAKAGLASGSLTAGVGFSWGAEELRDFPDTPRRRRDQPVSWEEAESWR
jgi:hypothetical protein